MEFLIRRADHGDWDSKALDADVCRPASMPFRMLSGPREEPRFEVSGTEFQFIYEMPGMWVPEIPGQGFQKLWAAPRR
jgi:hypothetical protein